MADETSPASLIGGGDDYGRFMSSVGGKISQFLPSTSNPNQRSSGAAATLTASIDKLAGKIDSLISTMGGSNFGGSGAGGGKRNGGDSTFGGGNGGGFLHSPLAKWGGATATLGLAGISSLWNNNVNTALGLYPGAQQIASYSGLAGNAGMNQTFGALRNGGNSQISGATGSGDAVNAAGILAQAFRSGIGPGSRGQTALGYSSLTARVMGTDLSGGASLYSSLRDPALSWALMGHKMGNFVGTGLGQVNPVAQSMGILGNIPGFNVNGPNALNQLTQNSQNGGKLSASVFGATGGNSTATDAILKFGIAQLTYMKNGGTGTLGPNSTSQQFSMAGLNSTATDAMRKAGIKLTDQESTFAQTQAGNISTTLAVQLQMRDLLNKIAMYTAPLGKFTPYFSGILKAVEAIAAFRIATGGTMGGLPTSVLGGSVPAAVSGSTLGAAAAPIAAIASAGALNQASKSILGHGVGSMGQVTGPGDKSTPINTPGHHKSFWSHLFGGMIGDPPSSNNISDSAFVQQHNRTGHGDSVTGLQGGLLHDVAGLMRANPRLVLNSGFRSRAEQQRLWNASDKTGRMVAKPGNSMHERGLAVDLGPPSEYGWLRTHGGKYGLVNYAPEPWHWEPRGASNAGNRTDYGVSGTAPAGGGGATQSGASTSGSFAVNMGMNAATASGSYGQSQGSLAASLLGSGTEQGSVAYHYAGGGGGSFYGGGGGGSTGGGAIAGGTNVTGGGKLPGSFRSNTMGHTSIDAKNLAGLLKGAGFSTKVNPAWGHSPLVEMLAIAMGESGLHIDAVGDTGLQNSTWGPSIGLFQDRTLRGATGTGGPRDINAIWGSAAAQVKAAFQLSGGGSNLGPWGGPNYPGHKSHISQAEAAAGIGDAPMRGGGGNGSRSGNVALHSSSMPITANFHFNGGNQMTQSNAKQFAEWSFAHIQRLAADAENRNS